MSGTRQPTPAATTRVPGPQAPAKTPASPLPPGIGPSNQQQTGGQGRGGGTNNQATLLIPVTRTQEAQIISNVTAWQNSLYTQYALRGELENIDRIYMREKDWTEDQIKSRIANRKGDSTKIQNVTVPIVMPQVNSALTYLSNVFLTGYPMFPVVADPSDEDAALQLETVIQENATTAGWVRELTMFFRDGLKYNLHALECDWKQRTNWSVDTDVISGIGKTSAKAKKVLWEGNVLKRMDLYNTFWDPRVHPADMHKDGEFVGYTEVYSRIRFKKFVNDAYNQVPVAVAKAALESQPIQGAIGASLSSPFGYFIPFINPYPFYNKSAAMDWMNWATATPQGRNGVNYTNAYSVTTVYARILPSDYDFAVPERNTPQVWKFVIVNGQVVFSAERLTNIHNFIPIFFGQPIEDGLDYQTKSFAQNVSDMQEIGSALWNGVIASKRRLVGDRALYDPSRVSEKDINSTNPAAKIPVRPSAYGKPLQEAVYPFPYRDEQTDSLVQSTTAVVGMANLINGQNPAQQGQFVPGNKTRHEYDDVMGHGNGQNQQIAISIEGQVFTPLKEVIKLNVMQFQQGKDLYNVKKNTTVSIDPVDIRQAAVVFKVADGLIPSDKITGDDLMQTVFQQLGSSPQLASQYDLGDAFTYMLKTQGLDLTPFQKSPAQLQYEQALGAWQQAAAGAAKSGGNFSTPMPQPSPQLQQEQQQKQQGGGGVASSPTNAALQSTQG